MDISVQELREGVARLSEIIKSMGVDTDAGEPIGNLRLYNRVRQPPGTALRQISGGHLNGKTDINPQWRIEALTAVFGPVGIGWGYRILKLWNVKPSDKSGVVLAFARIALWYRDPVTHQRSEDIEGIGGNEMVSVEGGFVQDPDSPRDKMRVAMAEKPNDECYKMAVTDAISVCAKTIGVAGDIYAGAWDGSKYTREIPSDNAEPREVMRPPSQQKPQPQPAAQQKALSDEETNQLTESVLGKVMACATVDAAKAAANACLPMELMQLKRRPKERASVMAAIQQHISSLEALAAAGVEGPHGVGHGSRVLRSEEGGQS